MLSSLRDAFSFFFFARKISMLKLFLSGFCLLLFSTVNVFSLHFKTSVLQIWSQRLTKLVVLPLALFVALPMDPMLAATKNPEAIEIRRVSEQPVGAPTPVRKTSVKLPSGVEYFDYKEGDGDLVEEGKSVQFQWVLRRQNGYFVDSSANYNSEPFI